MQGIEIEIITEKTCKRCGRTLPIEEFAPSITTIDGYNKLCHECRLVKVNRDKDKRHADKLKRFWECDIIARPDTIKN